MKNKYAYAASRVPRSIVRPNTVILRLPKQICHDEARSVTNCSEHCESENDGALHWTALKPHNPRVECFICPT